MIDFVDEFSAVSSCWPRLFNGELHEIILPKQERDWVWTNPSILKSKSSDYICAIRLMIAPWLSNHVSVVTIANIDLCGVPTRVKQIKPPPDDREFIEGAPVMHYGAHDCRIFRVGGQLFGTATIFDNTKQCVQPDGKTMARIGLIQISDDYDWEKTTMLPSLYNGIEKNWMPIEGEMSWLYFPSRNIFGFYDLKKESFKFKQIGRTSEILASARGGTQLIDIGNDRLLGVVHETALPKVHTRIFAYRMRYAHKFVLYSRKTKNLIGFSPHFHFITSDCIEFAAGLTLSHEGDKVIVSFGYRDMSAWLASAKLNDIMATMQFLPANFD